MMILPTPISTKQGGEPSGNQPVFTTGVWSKTARLQDQNELFAKQNSLITTQNTLVEASRRSAMESQLSSIFDAVERAIKDKGIAEKQRLPGFLEARIISSSISFRPYQDADLQKDAEPDRLSPQRGQLLVTLANSPVDMSQILKSARFWYADLVKVELRGAFLQNAKLKGANLRDANLIGTDLTDAVLVGATLRSAKLDDAILQDAQLFRADLDGAGLRKAKLQGAVLIKAVLVRTSMEGARLEGANLEGAYVSSLIGSPKVERYLT